MNGKYAALTPLTDEQLEAVFGGIVGPGSVLGGGSTGNMPAGGIVGGGSISGPPTTPGNVAVAVGAASSNTAGIRRFNVASASNSLRIHH